jgi:predicted nuclease of predicted toxin-antitoxin system
MKFLIDECTGTTVANWFVSQGYEVFSVFDSWRGATDDELLSKAFTENYILVTMDKDFGEMIFRYQKPHKGIIFLRCEPNNFKKRIEVLTDLLANYSDKLPLNFVVVTNENVRIIPN